MFLFCKTEILLLLFVQLRKSPRKSWNFDAKSPGMSWKVLEFASIFLVGTTNSNVSVDA